MLGSKTKKRLDQLEASLLRLSSSTRDVIENLGNLTRILQDITDVQTDIVHLLRNLLLKRETEQTEHEIWQLINRFEQGNSAGSLRRKDEDPKAVSPDHHPDD